jgi:hypothetical protein
VTALAQQEVRNKRHEVKSGGYKNNVFDGLPHHAVCRGRRACRADSSAVYASWVDDGFRVKDDKPMFLAVVTESQSAI